MRFVPTIQQLTWEALMHPALPSKVLQLQTGWLFANLTQGIQLASYGKTTK
jgi:hypothetical protein